MRTTNKKPGRRRSTTSKSSQVRRLLATGMSTADIAKKVGCTPNLVYVIRSNMGGASKRGPGRPRKAPAGEARGLADFLGAVQNADRERTQLRRVLERIQAVIATALA